MDTVATTAHDRRPPSGTAAHRHRAFALGSMLRPEPLLRARTARDEGQLSPAGYKRAEDRAVDDAIRAQELAGLDVVSDGEMRRATFMDHLLATVEGAERMAVPLETSDEPDEAYRVETDHVAITERLRPARRLSVEEYSYARARTERPLKMTLPSPLLLNAFWSAEHSAAAYPDPFDLFAHWADMLRAEIVELVALGCTYVQIDAPDLAVLVDPVQRDLREQLGISVERTLHEGVAIIDALAAVPGAEVSLHLCKGNFRSQWAASGGYGLLAEHVFRATPHVRSYFLEFDDERSGDFEPLAHVPEHAGVVLGLVSTKNERLEPLEELRERVRRAADHVGLDRLAVSTQCGFASVASGPNAVSRAVQQAKLTRVAELAELVWAH